MSIFDEPAPKPISTIGERYWNNLSLLPDAPTFDEISYLHIIFAQTGFPYSEVPLGQPFQRRNGAAVLGLTPGYLMNPATRKLELQKLPYGTIPRLLMLHICTEATSTQKQTIDMNRSMTQFLRDDLLICTNGGPRGGMTAFKGQMNSVAATPITIGLNYLTGKGGRGATTFKPTPAIVEYRVWDEKSLVNRVPWNTEVILSDSFFGSLITHSVPLDFRAIQALRKSPLSLDIYFTLAYRLHDIAPGKVESPTWSQLREQFGMEGYELKIFKYRFLGYLKDVLRFYPDAKIEVTDRGLSFRRSKPPIPKRLLLQGHR